jgi:integrase/recombinase XerD
MAIYPHPSKGKGWWLIRISHGRHNKQENITYQGTKAEAIAFEADLRGIPAESIHQKPTDILGRFLDWYYLENSTATATAAETTLPRIINRLGNKPLTHYRQTDYTRYKQHRAADGVSRKTVNIELGYWRALLNYAKNELQIPVPEMPKLYTKKQTRPPVKIVLTPDEIARLLAELHGDKKTIAMLYAFCGLRRDEALHLKRGNIDLERGLLHIRGKGDKSRIVPIVGDQLKQRIKKACIHHPKIKRGKQTDKHDKKRDKQNHEYLFICPRTNAPYTNIKKGIKAAALRAGITKPVHNHLLRHAGATAAIQAGVNLRSLQAMLGHSDIRMTEIYTHMAADLLIDEAAKMATLHNASAESAKHPPKKANGPRDI